MDHLAANVGLYEFLRTDDLENTPTFDHIYKFCTANFNRCAGLRIYNFLFYHDFSAWIILFNLKIFQYNCNVHSYFGCPAHTFETFLCKRYAAWAMNLGNGLFWLVALFFVACNLSFGGTRESQLRIGKAINIFVRYGYLGISMRVIPYNDSYEADKWLFKEPTKSIYKVHRRRWV